MLLENQKLSFAVENIEIVETEIDRSQFSLLRVDAFSTGKSLHDTFTTEENLRKASATILQKPFVFYADSRTDDASGHDDREVAAGFVPHNSRLEFNKMSDGRLMLTCDVLVWKRYSGDLLRYFKRDGGKKGVSVEIEIFESKKDSENGLLELVDFVFNAITCLGEFITPAMPDAKAILAFSVEFEDAKKKFEFSSRYNEVDFVIPDYVKKSAQKSLDNYRENGGSVSSVALANARFLVKNEKMSPERMRQLHKNIHRNVEMDDVTLGLWGGNQARQWSAGIVERMDQLDTEILSYYESEADNGEGIEKEPASDKYEEEAKPEDENPDGEVYLEEKEEISHMKKDEKDLKKDEMAEEEKPEEGKPEEKFEEQPPEEKEDMAADEKEKEDNPEEEKKDEMAMSLNANLDVAAMLAFLKNETEQYREMKELEPVVFAINSIMGEVAKGKDANLKTITTGMLAHMDAASKILLTSVKQNVQFSKENKDLKEFKSTVEKDRKNFEVETVLKEAFEAGMPESEVEKCREDSANFALENIDSYKNMVKAKAFQYVGNHKERENDGIIKMAFPFNAKENKEPSLWK